MTQEADTRCWACQLVSTIIKRKFCLKVRRTGCCDAVHCTCHNVTNCFHEISLHTANITTQRLLQLVSGMISFVRLTVKWLHSSCLIWVQHSTPYTTVCCSMFFIINLQWRISHCYDSAVMSQIDRNICRWRWTSDRCSVYRMTLLVSSLTPSKRPYHSSSDVFTLAANKIVHNLQTVPPVTTHYTIMK